jgi:hypothetical protein
MVECTLAILAGVRDTVYAGAIAEHIYRSCRFNFAEVLLVIDDCNFDDSVKRLAEDRINALRSAIGENIRIAWISKFLSRKDEIAKKYFGVNIRADRDHRGIPMFGWIAGLEEAQTDHVLHCDSDILFYQDAESDWVSCAIDLIEKDPSVMFVAPRPGPPAANGALLGQSNTFFVDNEGNYRFKTLSSRRFLVRKSRLAALLPIQPVYTSWKRRLLMQCGAGNALSPWETCVSEKLQRSKYFRVHLGSSNAWTLHCPDHSPEWITALPDIIAKVESGSYPEKQAGLYDLQLQWWLSEGFASE